MKELDGLTNKVFVNSTCNELNALAFLNQMEDKEPMLTANQTLAFTTTDNYTVDMSMFLNFVSSKHQKLSIAQATKNFTEDRTQITYRMGNQLGVATQLFQKRGKVIEKEQEPTNDSYVYVGVIASVVILSLLVACCMMHQRKKRVNKLPVGQQEEHQDGETSRHASIN